MESTKSIILVDDHNLFRCGLKIMLESENKGKIIAEAKNGEEFLEQLNSMTPDLVIMDIDMPVIDGITATEIALKKFPDLNILILSMHGDQNHFHKLINIGAKGFVLKSSGKSELEEAIETVSQGDYYFSRDLLKNIVIEPNLDSQYLEGNKESPFFTERESIVLFLLCKGFTDSEIAEQLFLSILAIDDCHKTLLKKTNTRNTAELIVFVLKNRIVNVF